MGKNWKTCVISEISKKKQTVQICNRKKSNTGVQCQKKRTTFATLASGGSDKALPTYYGVQIPRSAWPPTSKLTGSPRSWAMRTTVWQYTHVIEVRGRQKPSQAGFDQRRGGGVSDCPGAAGQAGKPLQGGRCLSGHGPKNCPKRGISGLSAPVVPEVPCPSAQAPLAMCPNPLGGQVPWSACPGR